MTPQEFRDLANDRTDEQLVDLCLSDTDTPFVFDTEPNNWARFRQAISEALGIGPADIRVVGSGRFGFSLKPGCNLRRFQDTSDIDLAITNEGAFDGLWDAILAAAYPRPPISIRPGGWMEKLRNELYTGWISPRKLAMDVRLFGNKALPVIEFRTRWFDTLKGASRHAVRRHEDIQGRLYRTRRHLELYHLNSVASLRRSLSQ